MITVVVNFPLPAGMSPSDFKAEMQTTVPRYQQMPGLLRKDYLFDIARRIGGGAYLFESLDKAQACFNEQFTARVTERYGKPEIQYFDTIIQINNKAGTSTT